MQESILRKLEALVERYQEVEQLLSQQEVISDQDRFRELNMLQETLQILEQGYYVKNGKLDTSFKGFAKVGSSWMYFKNGTIDKSLNPDKYETICGTIDGVKAWYVVKSGKAYLDFTGFALVGESWMYYKNGKIDKSVTGAMNVTINGVKKWYYVNNGKANLTYTGFGKVGSSWMYFKNGSIDKSVTGIKSGKIDGVKAKYYVKAGKFQNTYSGTYKSGGKTYTIKNGKVTATK